MRIIVMILIGAMLVLAPGDSALAGQSKVTICHKGNTITIGAPAVDAHLRNHGDTVGACEVVPDTTTTTTTTTVPDVQTPTVCHEDEPCWDCETMGNKICGPGAGPPDDSHSHDPPPLPREHSHEGLILQCTVIEE